MNSLHKSGLKLLRCLLIATTVATLSRGAFWTPILLSDDTAITHESRTSFVNSDTGIELVGQTQDSPPPKYWYVFDVKDTENYLIYVDTGWGFTPLPPGEYLIKLTPGELGSTAVVWSTVKVEPGKTTIVKIDSGIELVGAAEDSPPPKYWYVFDAKDPGEYLTYVDTHWGVTPLPPGEYLIKLTPGEMGSSPIQWATVKVETGKITTIKIDSGIELVGQTEDSLPPKYWYVFDAKDPGEYLTYVDTHWGVTPLPPGDYVIKLTQCAAGSEAIPWGTVKVEAGKVARVKVDSGIDFVGPAETPPPEYCYVFDAKDTEKYLTYLHDSLGILALLPGEYVVEISPGNGGSRIPWGTVKVEAGKFATLKLDSGIELVGADKDSPPPEKWTVYDNANELSTYCDARWGSLILPPGDYRVMIEPNSDDQAIIRWTNVHVTSGEVIRINAAMTLPERLSRVTGVGRKTEKELNPEGYKKLEEEIEQAIRRGATWLKTQSTPDLADLKSPYPTIGILALIHSGEFERDPDLAARCIDFLMRRPLDADYGTYSTALTAMALRDIDPYRYRNRIFECTQWLVENQGWGDEERKVWGYGKPVPGIGEEKEQEAGQNLFREKSPNRRDDKVAALEVIRKGLIAEPDLGWDNSNAQFAVLGLHSSANSGIGIPRESWQRVADHFLQMQSRDSGWNYHFSGNSYGSMTCSGLASYVVARHHLGEKNPTLDPAAVAGLEWLAGNFTVEKNPEFRSDHYYYLYGLERAGMLAGTEFFGEQEWYPVGARYLLEHQNGDGSWRSSIGPATGNYPEYLDTCYAILFLRRATLPLEPVKPAFLEVTAEKENLPAALLPAVEVILDSSGSMKEFVGNETKIKIAQTVMADVLDRLPDTIQLGLRLYGHRNGSEAKPSANGLDAAAKTTRLVLPIAPLTQQRREKVKEWVNWAAPWGWTPMVHSVLQAKDDFVAGGSSSQTIVLISDGVETCGGKIEDIGTAYRNSGIDIVIHVVGFDVEKDPAARKQLMEIATLGGGKYFNANDAAGLSDALDQALQGIEFIVIDPSTGNEVSRGDINDEPIALKPGKYAVHVSGLKTNSLPIELIAEQVLELKLDEKGQLAPLVPEKE